MNPRTVRLLRALGYRYSYNREAWVHRVGGGRVGPVFTEVANSGITDMTGEQLQELQARLNDPDRIRIAPAEERAPLPQRTARRRDERLLPVRWLHEEEHKLVYVDGRPPLVGHAQRARQDDDPTAAPVDRPTVVPLKGTRATG
ncbi:MAG: hypothetical protein KDA98_10565 [Acidimicrobiales bacterium]|nr:hypothetical protein [Acidimicrobiales bacterium]